MNPLAPYGPQVVLVPFPHFLKYPLLVSKSFDTKHVMATIVLGGGGSTHKNRSLADSSKANHIP
jgi:hypothetical protein